MINLEFIFLFQLGFSVVVYAFLYNWIFAENFLKLERHKVLFYLTIPHAFRHLGLVFLVPGLVSKELNTGFATPTAYGDLLTAFLALLSMFLLRSNSKLALPLVWIFNIVGTVDLILALSKVEAIPYLHSAWIVPTMVVPLLLVTHIIIFKKLMTK